MTPQVATVFVVAVTVQTALSQTVNVEASTLPGIEILGASAPDYRSAIDQILGPVRSSDMEAWLPFGIVLKNNTSQTIAAVAVTWDLTNAMSQASAKTFKYRTRHELFTQPRRQIAPGKRAVAHWGLLVPEGTRVPARVATGNLANFQNSTSIRVTLDGVVFASGQFVGPDSQAYEYYQVHTTVPPQIAAKVLAMRDAGEPAANIVKWLQAVAVSDRGAVDQTAHETARTARGLLSHYRARGEASLYQVAAKQSEPPIRVFR
jgi:hypothetical protein